MIQNTFEERHVIRTLVCEGLSIGNMKMHRSAFRILDRHDELTLIDPMLPNVETPALLRPFLVSKKAVAAPVAAHVEKGLILHPAGQNDIHQSAHLGRINDSDASLIW